MIYIARHIKYHPDDDEPVPDFIARVLADPRVTQEWRMITLRWLHTHDPLNDKFLEGLEMPEPGDPDPWQALPINSMGLIKPQSATAERQP